MGGCMQEIRGNRLDRYFLGEPNSFRIVFMRLRQPSPTWFWHQLCPEIQQRYREELYFVIFSWCHLFILGWTFQSVLSLWLSKMLQVKSRGTSRTVIPIKPDQQSLLIHIRHWTCGITNAQSLDTVLDAVTLWTWWNARWVSKLVPLRRNFSNFCVSVHNIKRVLPGIRCNK